MPKEYSVQIEDDVVTPEETLLDSGSGFSDIERSIAPEVFKFMFWGISFILGVIFVFSAKLSIANFDYYSNLMQHFISSHRRKEVLQEIDVPAF